MGSFYVAEVCELVGLYILDTMKKKQIFDFGYFGLYRDVASTDNLPGPRLERKFKKLSRAFKNIGFDITTEAKLIKIYFLDVTLYLVHNIYMPYENLTRKQYTSTKNNIIHYTY